MPGYVFDAESVRKLRELFDFWARSSRYHSPDRAKYPVTPLTVGKVAKTTSSLPAGTTTKAGKGKGALQSVAADGTYHDAATSIDIYNSLNLAIGSGQVVQVKLVDMLYFVDVAPCGS